MRRAPFVMLVILPAMAACSGTNQGVPPEDRIPAQTQDFSAEVLAQNTSGGWLNIDFIHSGSPLEEAQRCVRTHTAAEAVACFGFASRDAYEAAAPEEAGNFKGLLCWDARWQRNKLATESGGTNRARPSSCPATDAPPL